MRHVLIPVTLGALFILFSGCVDVRESLSEGEISPMVSDNTLYTIEDTYGHFQNTLTATRAELDSLEYYLYYFEIEIGAERQAALLSRLAGERRRIAGFDEKASDYMRMHEDEFENASLYTLGSAEEGSESRAIHSMRLLMKECRTLIIEIGAVWRDMKKKHNTS